MKNYLAAALILGIIFLVIFSAPRENTTSTVDQKEIAGAESLPIIIGFFVVLGLFAFAVGKYYPHNDRKQR